MLARKQIRTFRRGRVNARREVARQLRIRTNLEKQYYKRLNTLFRRFVNVRTGLYREYGIYNVGVAQRALNEELLPTTLAHYRRVFRTIYDSNNEIYDRGTKDEEIFVMGRSLDFEKLVNDYFRTRTLILSGISARIARRIDSIIKKGRADDLTLTQIAREITNKVIPLTRSRAALIARTETHNAASYASHQYHDQVRNDLGIKMLKRWTATNDERTRSAHSQANGQTVDMDEKFTVGGTQMEYAGDPAGGAANTVNCRCVIIYVDEDDIVE
tara:strand:+ start:1821 stop:2636 length:816 start_codon:yes stop_codon:yes gene_type:complete